MSNVIKFPAESVDTLWQRYQALAVEAAGNPRLAADRNHCEAMLRAYGAWRDRFFAEDRAA